MKKALLILACGFLLVFSVSKAPAAMSNEEQAVDQWRVDKNEISVVRIESSKDMYFPALPVVQGLYMEWASIADWPRKTFARGEDAAFIICASVPFDGWTTWEWAVYRNGQMIYYGYVDYELTQGDWKLTAPLTIPSNAPPGKYEWSARFSDEWGHVNAYPVKIPIVIVIP